MLEAPLHLILITLKQRNSTSDELNMFLSCAGGVTAQSVFVGVLLSRPRVDHESTHVEFVVDKVGQGFSSENVGVTVSFLQCCIVLCHSSTTTTV